MKSKGKRYMKLALLMSVITAVVTACSSLTKVEYMESTSKMLKKTENYKDGKFVNTKGELKMLTSGTYGGLIKKMLFWEEEREPENPLETVNIDPLSITGAGNDGLKVTWLGHSSTIIEIEGKVILTDPVFSKRVSPLSFLGPKRYHKKSVIEPDKIRVIDAVIISHDHYDHLDEETIKKIKDNVRMFVVPLGVGTYLKKWGVDEIRITELDWWYETELPGGLTIAATPSQHFSGRGLFNRDSTLWASWAIIGKKRRVFFSGDSGYTEEFKEIGKKYGPFDITLMENGQYNEQWQDVHMLPEESLQAHIDLKGKVMLPIHWGAYNLSVHDWYEPVERLQKAAINKNVVIATPRIGGSVVYGKSIPVAKWWKGLKGEKKIVKAKKKEQVLVPGES